MAEASSPLRLTKAANQYLTLELNSRLETADAHQLVAILYEELDRALDVLQRTLAQGRPITSHPQVDRARSILISLEASLDFKAGGELSETLALIYRSMRQEMALCAVQGTAERLIALREGIQAVSVAWSAIRR